MSDLDKYPAMQIADVVHQRPWVPGMDAILPPGSRVLVKPHDLGGLNPMVRLLPLVEEGPESKWWYVHHTSLIPLACEPARPMEDIHGAL